VGVDLSEVFVAAARARVAELNAADRIEIVLGPGYSWLMIR
jgi:hypothetical protein